ncbi:MAG: beta-N-acetylhexosaminidase [Thermodesulfobacteriota bacterium]
MNDSALNELVGQRLVIGFEGQELSPDLESLLLTVRPGGIILFKRNVGGGPKQTAGLIAACQDLARSEFGRPLLVAVDQEGGPVTRLGPPFTQLPSQRRMARTMSRDQVRALAETSGRELAAIGVNLNLTPVLDLAAESASSFMSERSFGDDPGLASTLGLALIDGHAAQGVLTCAKHFPGLGSARLDPHHDLPTLELPAVRLAEHDFVPFRQAINHGVAAVMTTHVLVPALDPAGPATFSRIIATDILRDRLGFQGLILTDDLEMGAVVKHYRPGPAAVLAARAGHDLLLVCRRPDLILAAREALLEAAAPGDLARRRWEESAERIASARARIEFPSAPALKEVFDLA